MTTLLPYIKIPTLNPFRFHLDGDGDYWENQIPSFEQQTHYLQKYQFGDRLYFQFQCTEDPSDLLSRNPTCTLEDNDDNILATFTINPTISVYQYPNYNQYNIYGTFPTVTEGMYFLRLRIVTETGRTMNFLSEPIYLKATHENTVALEYKLTDSNDYDFIFTDAIQKHLLIRVEGGVKSDGFQPGGKYEMYQDLDFEPVMLQAIPYNVFRFTFGPSEGMPNWLVDKINRALSLDDVLIDGIGYMRNEGAKLEPSRDYPNPMAGWSIELLKTIAEHSDEYGDPGSEPAENPLTCDINTITCDSIIITSDQTIY